MDQTLVKVAAKKYPEYVLHPYGAMVVMDGFDAVCAFAMEFGSSKIYVPRVRTIFKECIEMDILNQRGKKSIRELAKVYGFSEQHIRNILRNGG